MKRPYIAWGNFQNLAYFYMPFGFFSLFLIYYIFICSLFLYVTLSPPSSHSICMVSCVTKEGIRDLQDRIHAAALNAKDPDTHEHVIGMQVLYMYYSIAYSNFLQFHFLFFFRFPEVIVFCRILLKKRQRDSKRLGSLRFSIKRNSLL